MVGDGAVDQDSDVIADRTAPRKQRHTARRVWERLVEEHDVKVAESTVRDYVRAAKRRLVLDHVEVTIPQHHELGAKAEVDFGSVRIYLAGVLTEVELFVMRMSASGKAFRHAYGNEAQEVFLDGHVHAFESFGGVPSRIRYDNLKTAVVKVLQGRSRVESERFVALRSHYGFESFFCRPGIDGAHEKGGVEGEIGRFRRRRLVPVPKVSTLAELNAILHAAVESDDARHIDSRFMTVNGFDSRLRTVCHSLHSRERPGLSRLAKGSRNPAIAVELLSVLVRRMPTFPGAGRSVMTSPANYQGSDPSDILIAAISRSRVGTGRPNASSDSAIVRSQLCSSRCGYGPQGSRTILPNV